MQSRHRPASLSVNEEFGLLVDGFDTPSMLLMGYDPAWAGGHIEAAGYTKAKDLIAYRYDPRQGLPRRVTAFAAKLEQVDGARIRCFDKRAFDHDLAAVLAVFNDAWSENWGYRPHVGEGDQSARGRVQDDCGLWPDLHRRNQWPPHWHGRQLAKCE